MRYMRSSRAFSEQRQATARLGKPEPCTIVQTSRVVPCLELSERRWVLTYGRYRARAKSAVVLVVEIPAATIFPFDWMARA
jgi:hypothetical protein